MSTAHSFGAWVQRARKHAGLTQEALANSLGYSVSLLRKFESGKRRPTPDMVERLAEALAIPASERSLFARMAHARLSSVPPHATSAPPTAKSSFPARIPVPPTLFIGRATQLASLVAQLRQPATRMLTLVGSPGIGKTRLAIEVALQLHYAFADGVCVVELAPLRDATKIPEAVLAALNEQPNGRAAETQLIDMMCQQQLLLVLDNCEHLLAGTAFTQLVSKLFAACPYLKLLATSRTAFQIRVERQIDVLSLALPAKAHWHDPVAVGQAEATAFFLDRVRAINAHYELSAATAAPIAELCERLDGVPLGLELLAARAAKTNPSTMLVQFVQRLPWLADGPRDLPERQQTLRNAIRWSYDLLAPDQQASFARLGVFVGGCTPDAATAVGAASLERVHNASLIQYQPTAQRYTMLESLREFALERLEQHDELCTAQRQHAAFFEHVATQAEPQLSSQDTAASLAALDADIDNLRAAMRWSLAHDQGATAGRIALALLQYWRSRGLLREGSSWLMQALEHEPTTLSIEERARMFQIGGFLQSQHADMQAINSFQQSLVLYRSIDHRQGEGRVLNLIGMLARYPGNYERARTYLDEAYALLQAHSTAADVGIVLGQIGSLLSERGKYIEAEQHHRKSIALCLVDGIPRNIQINKVNIAFARWRQGDYTTAGHLYQEVLAYGHTNMDREVIAMAQQGLGRIALHYGDFVQAQQAYTESLALAREIGLQYIVVRVLPYIAYMALLRKDYDQARNMATKALQPASENFAIEAVVTNSIILAACAIAQNQPEHAARWLGVASALIEVFSVSMDTLFTQLATETRTGMHTQRGKEPSMHIHNATMQEVHAQIPTVQFPTVYEAMQAIDLLGITKLASTMPYERSV